VIHAAGTAVVGQENPHRHREPLARLQQTLDRAAAVVNVTETRVQPRALRERPYLASDKFK